MKGKLKYRKSAFGVSFIFFAGMVFNVQGGLITSRTDLLAQLGSSAVTEDFEGYIFPANTARRVGNEINSTSVINGQGPGLIKPGVRFIESPPGSGFGSGLQWDRQFEYGTTSAALVTDNKLVIDFTVPVSHVGLDMFWFNTGFPPANPSTVEIYGTDDTTLLYSTNIFEPPAPDFHFFGYANSGGIGRVVLFRNESGGLGVSPMIDNVTFGLVPDPLLSIAAHGQQVTLAWPAAATGFQLEISTNLTSWSAVTNVPVSTNGLNAVELPVLKTSKFFRLHSQ